jgi:hypothetical protein
MSALSRAILKLQADVAVSTPESLGSVALLDVRTELTRVSDLLTAGYLR